MSTHDIWLYEEQEDASRWMYVVGGSMLVWLGLRRWSLPAALVTTFGAALLSRGLAPSGSLSIRAADDAPAGSDTPREERGDGPRRAPEAPRSDPDREDAAAPGNAVREALDAEDEVDESSDESFPASDPPSWTPTTSAGSHGV